jgi:preprotein translocase subunit SecD
LTGTTDDARTEEIDDVARPTRAARPGRALLALLALLIVLYGVVVSAHVWGTGPLTPKLGLDLEGGDEIVLQPVTTKGQSVSQGTLNEAINIIRARVNGTGVSEAQVTSQGGKNIVVSLPGHPSEADKRLVKTAAQLRFRAVIQAEQIGLPPAPTGTATGPGTATGTPSGTATSGASATSGSSATTSTAGRAIPQALVRSGTTRAAPTPTTTAGGTATGTATAGTTPTAKPTDASDPNWVTPAIQAQFDAETCQDLNKFRSNTDDPTKPFVTCSADGSEKYILGPVELSGTDIKSAQAQLQTNSQGIQTTTWEVQLNFTGGGTNKFGKVTERLVGLPDPRNRFAIEIDGTVIEAPTTQSAIVGGIASITGGGINQTSARELANQLKYGALPISFNTLTEDTISPTLGQEQLNKSLLAGLIGLLLVVIYAFFQYRLLGLVTVASLSIAASLTYGMVVYLGWAQGFRLTLAGVTGLIVSIGITADSFIVFFERVRDEVRDGRTLRSAVETGWGRARRTIIAADSVSFLAAVVLYLLATGGVQGFAYTLGLTTLIDVLVVFLFTHPMLALLARTRFFGEGHRWSGLDPERLGVTARRRRTGPSTPVPATAVAGVASRAPAASAPAASAAPARSGDTIAARRAAARKAAERGEDA